MKYVFIDSQLHFEKTIWYNLCISISLLINIDIYPSI